MLSGRPVLAFCLYLDEAAIFSSRHNRRTLLLRFRCRRGNSSLAFRRPGRLGVSDGNGHTFRFRRYLPGDGVFRCWPRWNPSGDDKRAFVPFRASIGMTDVSLDHSGRLYQEYLPTAMMSGFIARHMNRAQRVTRRVSLRHEDFLLLGFLARAPYRWPCSSFVPVHDRAAGMRVQAGISSSSVSEGETLLPCGSARHRALTGVRDRLCACEPIMYLSRAPSQDWGALFMTAERYARAGLAFGVFP